MITPTAVPPRKWWRSSATGLRAYAARRPVYIRPMYWALDGSDLGIAPMAGRDRLRALPGRGADDRPGGGHHPDPHPVPPPGAGRRRLQRQGGLPLPQQRADAGRGARPRASATRWWPTRWAMWPKRRRRTSSWCKDGVVFTPIPNGTFLAGITRARHIANLRADGVEVREAVLSFEDVRGGGRGVPVGQLRRR